VEKKRKIKVKKEIEIKIAAKEGKTAKNKVLTIFVIK